MSDIAERNIRIKKATKIYGELTYGEALACAKSLRTENLRLCAEVETWKDRYETLKRRVQDALIM